MLTKYNIVFVFYSKRFASS